MKNLRKILAAVLIVSMVFTTQGFFTLANGTETSAKVEDTTTTIEEASSKEQSSENKDYESKETEETDESESGLSEKEGDETTSTAKVDEEETSDTLESSKEKEKEQESSETEETSNKEESSDESTTDTSHETSTKKVEETESSDETFATSSDAKKTDIVEEETPNETATASETENIKEKAEMETATASEANNKNTLFGDGEKVASESDAEPPKIKIDESLFLGNIDVDYVAPFAEPKNNGLFGADPLADKWDSREHSTGALSWISPIRNQSPYGICWAFATAGMVETSIRKKGLVNNEADSNLSELALAYFMYNLERVTNNNNYRGTPGLEGYDYTTYSEQYYIDQGHPEKATFSQCGGNLSLSTKMISSYVGMVVEDENTNFTDDRSENEAMRKAHTQGIAPEYAFDRNGYVANNIQIINRDNRDAIKQAIMDNGSVGFAYYSEPNTTDSSGYWNDAPAFHWETIGGEKYCYYHSQNRVDPSGRPQTNHAIMIVGWDDNVEASKFYYGGALPYRDASTGWEYVKDPQTDEYNNATYKSTQNGAWLARNSWGLDYPFLSEGYFYIPYDEPSLSETFYSVDAIRANTYKYNYNYDTTGNSSCDDMFNSSSGLNGNFGNIYKVSGTDDAQVIEAVNVGVNSANAEYDIKIYTKDTPMADPTDGVLRSTKRGSNTLAGLYTFELDDKVQVAKDTYFSIVVEPLNSNAIYLFYDSVDDAYGWYQTYNAAELGQSYYRKRNNTTNYTAWVDMNSDDAYPYLKNKRREIDGQLYGNNWRIKALANPGMAVSFESNGGTGDMTAQVIEAGVPTKLKKNTFKKDGYRFLKWVGTDGNEYEDEAEITITGSVVLTAQWEVANYTFAPGWFDANLIGMTGNQLTSIKLSMYPSASPSNVDASYIIQGSGGLIVSRKGTELNIYAPDKSMSGKIDVASDASYLFTNTMVDPFDPTGVILDQTNSYKKCEKIEGMDLLNTSNVTKMYRMFFAVGLENVFNPTTGNLLPNPKEITLDVSSFDTRNVSDMSYMFEQTGIKNINLDSLSTYSLRDTSYMFAECYYLQNLDLRQFKTATVSDAHGMFTYCFSLTNINFDTDVFGNVTDMSYMFDHSTAFTILNLSSFNTANVTNMSGMFSDCTALTKIIVSQNKFKLDSLTQSTDMFAGCTQLRGGNNTGIAGNPVDATYARIDKPSEPGYFTGADSVAVTFDLNGKGVNFVDYFEKGTQIIRPADPTYAGYTFVHWYEEGTSENIPYNFDTVIPMTSGSTKRLIAKWNANQYTVDYNLGGVGATKPNPITKTYRVDLTAGTLKNPTNIPTGYTFVGWYKEASLTTVWTGTGADADLTTGTTTQTIYAKWKARVTFNLKGHGALPSGTSETNDIVLGDSITLPTLANVTGYTFDTTNSWYERSDLTGTNYAAGSSLTVSAPKNLYAKWNENSYTITYLKDGGEWAPGFDESTVSTRKYTQSMTLPVELNIVKTGYKFLGWYKEGDTSKTVITSIAANTDESVRVVAKWFENSYDIILNDNGGEYVSTYDKPTTRKYSQAITLPTNDDIKRTGYRLEGWHEQSNFSDAAVLSIPANTAAHKTFYAKWELVPYAVTLNTDGGTIVEGDVTSYTYGTGATLPTNVTKDGFVFKGWWTQNGKTSGNWGSEVTNIPTTATGAKTYYARWAASFIVSFDLTSIAPAPDAAVITNAPSEQNIEDGSTAVRPIDPSAINFEFKGWFTAEDGAVEYDFNSPITGATTIFAKWEEAVTYDLTFNVVSGKIHPSLDAIKNAPEVQHIVSGKVATKPIDPSATGYKFIDWYTDDTFKTVYDFATAVSEPKMIYAKWELQKYSITYEVNGGIFESGYKVITEREYGKEVTLPTADNIAKYGFTFAGWYEDDTFTKSAGTKIAGDVTKDVVLYASWTKNANTFIITFNSNYDGQTFEQAFVLGENTDFKTDIFTRTGYTFLRWKDTMGNVYINTNQLTGNIVLYAEWQENPKPSPTPYDPGDHGGSGGSSRGGSTVGPIPQNQINNQTTTQVKVSTSKSEQIVVNGNTSQWIYDPVKNTWKMNALDLMGTPVSATNGFYIVAQVNIVLENNTYVQKVSNDTYYFDTEGNMVTGWVQTNDDKWYFFNNEKTVDEGKLCLGWKQIDGSWYFFSTNDGSMLTNTTTSDGYKIGADGKWVQ